MEKIKSRNKYTVTIISILILIVLQTLPIFYKRPLSSRIMYNESIAMFYQTGDDSGAMEIFELLTDETKNLYSQMKATQKDYIMVYIYTSQFSLSIRKAGLITPLFIPSQYIGNSRNANILMVSPNTNVKGQSHESIINATLHELVHCIIFQVNKNLPYFWNEGLAVYLANQKPSSDEIMSFSIPSMRDMNTKNGVKFEKMGGRAFSYKYIDFMKMKYGWDKVMAYAGGKGAFEQIFGKSESYVYQEWRQSLIDECLGDLKSSKHCNFVSEETLR